MHIEWSILPRGDVHPSHSRVYVTMNRRGEIAMNGLTYDRVGAPAAFLIMFDKTKRRIALKPTGATMKDSAIHTANDTIARSGNNASHALKFTKLAVSYVGELAKGCLPGRSTSCMRQAVAERP